MSADEIDSGRTADAECLESVEGVLRAEADAVHGLIALARSQSALIAEVCALIRGRCGDGQPGRLIATGVGKAGIIARKLSATFASTGTPSFFVHPTEARHGDLGMVQKTDVVLALSNSGASEELVALLPSLTHIGVPLLAIVGRLDSALARHAQFALSIGDVIEACPLGLAPSASTTAMLALGDALALTVQRQRKLTPEQYARYHPGGALGRKLMTCREAMRSGERVAAVPPHTSLLDCLRATSRARSGSVVLVDAETHLLGIFTDGDLRRVLSRESDVASVLGSPVSRYASMPCRSVGGDELLQAALRLCAERKFNELPVIDAQRRLIGLLDLQDLVERGFALSP
jgi:arabinose-5-phosphate isomerase